MTNKQTNIIGNIIASILSIGAIMVFIAVIAMILSISNTRTNSLTDLQNCINTVAQQEQYTGSPYSKQAWELFATSCTLTVYKIK